MCNADWLQRKDGGVDFELATRPIPSPGPLEVLVRLSVTGLCGTDIGVAHGELGPSRDILGHEGVGRVVEVGSAVPSSQAAIGQRVGVAWLRDVCNSCEMCLVEGGETRCLAEIFSGLKVDGTFAQYTLVPLKYLLKLPEEPTDELVAPILCGGVTIYKAIKICGAIPGQWLAISGAGGGVGALGIQYAKAMGYRVIALDAGSEKVELCKKLKADVFIDVTAVEDSGAEVRKATSGQGVAAVLVAAGSGRAYQDALGMLAPLGTLVCIGIPPPSGTVTFHPLAFISKGYRVIGSAVGTRGDILEAIDFVVRGQVIPIVSSIELGDLPDAAQRFKAGKVSNHFAMCDKESSADLISGYREICDSIARGK